MAFNSPALRPFNIECTPSHSYLRLEFNQDEIVKLDEEQT